MELVEPVPDAVLLPVAACSVPEEDPVAAEPEVLSADVPDADVLPDVLEELLESELNV
jgi:hypothetical protein